MLVSKAGSVAGVVSARLAAKRRPAVPIAVEVAQLEFVKVEELGQRGRPAARRRDSHQGAPAPLPDCRLDVLEDDLAALAVEFDCAAGRKEGEAVLDLLRDPAPAGIDDRPQPLLEAELRAVLTDQVDDGEMTLPFARRGPRPSCWVNRVADSVGRSSSRQSTSETSTPSPSTSTEKTQRSSPRPELVEARWNGGRVVLAAQRDALQAGLAELLAMKRA